MRMHTAWCSQQQMISIRQVSAEGEIGDGVAYDSSPQPQSTVLYVQYPQSARLRPHAMGTAYSVVVTASDDQTA